MNCDASGSVLLKRWSASVDELVDLLTEAIRQTDESIYRDVQHELRANGGRLRIMIDPACNSTPARLRVRLLRAGAERNSWVFAQALGPAHHIDRDAAPG